MTTPTPSRLGLLRDPDFGRLFAATALGQFGDRVVFLALPLVAIAALHADEFQVGALTSVTTAGSLLVGLPAGAWVDRIRKRSVMIWTDAARAAVLTSIPLAWWAGLLTIWWLYAVALLHGVLTVFFDVAHVSYVPHLVGRDKLVEGTAKLSAIRSVTSISGPGVAGSLVGWFGAPATLLVGSVGMAMSGLLATGIGEREQKPEAGGRRRLAHDIGEGLRFVLATAVLRTVVVGDALFNFFLVMYQTMLLVHLQREMGLGPSGIGLILSGMGCGALLGALWAPKVSGRLGQERVSWLAPLLTCPLTALMPLARPGWPLYVAAFGLACLSLGGVIRFVAQSSLQQSLTPDRLLGRMNATARFVSGAGIPLGGLAGGTFGSLYGTAATLWVGAGGMTSSVLPSLLSSLRASTVSAGGAGRRRPRRWCRRGRGFRPGSRRPPRSRPR